MVVELLVAERCFILAKVLDTLYTICLVLVHSLVSGLDFCAGTLEYYRTQVNSKSKQIKNAIRSKIDQTINKGWAIDQAHRRQHPQWVRKRVQVCIYLQNFKVRRDG